MENNRENETKYQQLYSTMMDAFGVVDMEGRFQEVNQAFLELVGYEKEELLERTYMDLTPRKWHAMQEKIIEEQVLVRGYSDIFLKEFRRKDGRIVPVELRIVLTRDAANNPIGTWAIVRDITDRIKSEEILRRFEYSVETSPEAVFWINRKGRFTYVNEQACQSLGYTREELMQLRLWDIDPHFPPERWGPHWEDMRKSGSRLINTIHQRKDGTVLPVEVSAKHVLFDNQEHHVANVRDISDRKKAQDTLQFFQYAIDESPDGAFWMGRDGGFLYVNDQACRSLGYTREELLEMHLWDIDPTFPPDRWSAHWEEMRTVQSLLIETVHRRKDGSIFPIEVSAYRLPFGDEERHLAFVRDITERKQAAEALKKSEERYRLLFDSNPQAMWVIDSETNAILAVNKVALRKYGYSESEFLAMKPSDINQASDDRRPPEKPVADPDNLAQIDHQRHRLKNGDLIDVEIHNHELTFEGRQAAIVLVNDITERLKAEAERDKLQAQLLQSQKLESIGRLAGGVAHDYNNMLGVIIGYAELMRTKLAPEDPLGRDLDQIQKAAVRSRDITQQLLAFSRKQVFELKILDPNKLIKDFEKTLSRLVGEDIDILFLPSPNIGKIEFDPTQIEQIVMNLVVNARDAMPHGGKLTMETADVCLDEAYCKEHIGFLPGDFVMITVSDNGLGMGSETVNQIFEPFFTTKELGKGTGLGLATVYGIVKQGGGFINVYSEPGQGTTFKIYIPAIAGEPELKEKTEKSQPELGSETVLLVEDEKMVRNMTQAILEKLGYKVISADGPEEALFVFEKEHRAIDLLITDVVMPAMNGKALYNRLKSLRPDLKVLYMSGYTTNVVVHHGVLDKDVQFITKPFSITNLANKVRETLNAV